MRTPHIRKMRAVVLLICIAVAAAVLYAAPAYAQGTALRGKIVYVSVRGAGSTNVSTLDDDPQLDLMVMNADGSGARRVDTGLSVHYDPQWSADGQSVLLAGWPGGLFVVNISNDRIESLGRLGFAAAWSPDEKHIAYATLDYDMQIMNADGTGSHPVSSEYALRGDRPSWSPDGRQLLFNYAVTPTESGSWLPVIVRIDADGKNLSLLDRRKGFIVFEAIPVGVPLLPAQGGEWSPDGRKIVFASEDEIYVAYSDGTGFSNLTSNDAIDRDATWSPDGEYILFSSDRAGSFDLYVMDAYGDNVRRLTTGGGNEVWPDWWAPPPGSEPEATATPPVVAVGRCTATASRTINLRSGAGTDFAVARQLDAGATVEINGQKTGSDGLIWFRLTTGEWAREDVIDESPACSGVPTIP